MGRHSQKQEKKDVRVLIALHAKGMSAEALPEDFDKAVDKIEDWAKRVPKPSTWQVFLSSGVREAVAQVEA